MGCANSHSVETSLSAYPFLAIEKTVIPLTADQKLTVQETWEIIEPYKKEIGVNVYIRFLSMNLNLKARFREFKDISVDEINKSNDHPRRLMAAIENSVSALNDSETFAGYVLELGRRHARLNFKPSKSHFIDLRKAFMSSIKEFLTSHWSSEVEESWVLLFDFMTGIMIKGSNSKS